MKDIYYINKVVRPTALIQLDEDIKLDSRLNKRGGNSGATGDADIVGHIPSQLKAKFEKALEQRELDADVVLTELIENYLNDFDPPRPSINEAKVQSDGDKAAVAQSKPRWAEENRSSQQFPMRLSTKLVDQIDADAKTKGITRTDWFVELFRSKLAVNPTTIPDDIADYKGKRNIRIRLDPKLNREVEAVSDALGIKKAEWARRLAWKALESDPISADEVRVPSGGDQTVSAQTKPRSFEHYRTTEEIPMRLGEQLVRQIDAAAKVSGVNRNQWLVQTIQSQIASAGADVHQAYPDYDQKRRIKVRLSSDLSSQVGDAANALGISKTEWIRRLASSQLNSTSPYPAPTI